MLAQCEDFLKAFHKKLCVDPEIFDEILNQIIDHPIFHSQSAVNLQLPVAVQLAIFLNHAGPTVMQFLFQMLHYGQEWVRAQLSTVPTESLLHCWTNMTLLLIFHPIQILLTTKMPKNMLVVLLASSGVMAG